MREHYENTNYVCGTSCSAVQRDPALEGQDIISQGTQLTSSAQMQGVLAGAKSPSNVTVPASQPKKFCVTLPGTM